MKIPYILGSHESLHRYDTVLTENVGTHYKHLSCSYHYGATPHGKRRYLMTRLWFQIDMKKANIWDVTKIVTDITLANGRYKNAQFKMWSRTGWNGEDLLCVEASTVSHHGADDRSMRIMHSIIKAFSHTGMFL